MEFTDILREEIYYEKKSLYCKKNKGNKLLKKGAVWSKSIKSLLSHNKSSVQNFKPSPNIRTQQYSQQQEKQPSWKSVGLLYTRDEFKKVLQIAFHNNNENNNNYTFSHYHTYIVFNLRRFFLRRYLFNLTANFSASCDV